MTIPLKIHLVISLCVYTLVDYCYSRVCKDSDWTSNGE